MKTARQKSIKENIEKQVDEILFRMLSTPHQNTKPKKKKEKRIKKPSD